MFVRSHRGISLGFWLIGLVLQCHKKKTSLGLGCVEYAVPLKNVYLAASRLSMGCAWDAHGLGSICGRPNATESCSDALHFFSFVQNLYNFFSALSRCATLEYIN